MNLVDWNQRLAEHFGALARDRKDIPIFALEHGLAPAEILALSNELRAQILDSPPSSKHSILWTVYAAEIGYGYAGDEYWQTFEDKTPGWTMNGKRSWIRDAYVAFQKKFSGAKPSGAWAEQFSIIAWPITHAILPRDLQQQLARVLYDIRGAFSAELFEEPTRLGEFIAARSLNTSARFQNLVQAPALIGQIAAALLLQGQEGVSTLLHPLTLKRISDDVDCERRGRDWLHGARHAAKARATIRGLTIGRPNTATFQRRDEAHAEVERLGIEPRLVLRPIEGSRWEVSLEIPDLSHLLFRFPEVREVLANSRCTVAGTSGRPLARGRCLHGPQRVALSRWPRGDDVLLKFERSDPQLEYLLRAECMLRPASSWLFKVASDGLAYESRGMRVRADTKYVLVSTEPFARLFLARPLELTCQGVYAVLLDVPPALTSDWEHALRQFQVSQAKSIEVWPAGLAAVAWDDEGHGEWLASENPTLAFRSDYAIDELTIAMGDGSSLSLTLTDTPPGEPIFVEFPPLPVGLHRCSVAARSGSGADSEVIGDIDIVMRVREAHPWLPGATAHGPLEVELDPAAPSLEQLWEGRAAVFVRGPVGRQVKCRVQMFARGGETPLFERALPPITLPISNDELSHHFDLHVKNQRKAQRAYDDAHLCEVEYSAEELGVFTLRCEREFTPLRWSVRRDSEGFVARLHDDAGGGDPAIERYSFERPNIAEKLPTIAEHRSPRGGGLFVATDRTYRAAIIVPPIVTGFSDIQCKPRIDAAQRTSETITTLISLAQLWGRARLAGDLIAGMRRRAVIRVITAQILSLLGGREWTWAERDLRAPNAMVELRRCIQQHNSEPDLGSKLKSYTAVVSDKDPRQRVLYLAALLRSSRLVSDSGFNEAMTANSTSVGSTEVNRDLAVGPKHSEWLAEFALRLASNPETLSSWAGEWLEAGVKRVLELPILARAARFLVLLVDQQKDPLAKAGEIYAGWEWPA